MDAILLLVLIILVVALLVGVTIILVRKPHEADLLVNAVYDVQTELRGVLERVSISEQGQSQSMSNVQLELRGISERFSTIEQIQNQAMNNVQVELRGISERVSTIEQINNVQTELRGISERTSTIEQSQNQATSNVQLELRGISERASTIFDLTAEQINNVQLELRGISERVSTVELNQNQSGQDIIASNTNLAVIGTLTRDLLNTSVAIRDELSRAKLDLTALQAHAKARQELEQRTADSIRRLETVMAGTQARGSAGENILELMLSKLPIEWQERNFRVGNKTVEFGLRLPNDLVLPIDSKWTGTELLEQFCSCEDIYEQQRLKSQIEDVVRSKAKEIRKYIDPNLTVSFGVAVIPDAVYELCSGIHLEAFQSHVVLVSYSMFVPYLLLVFQTVLKESQSVDIEKLDDFLKSAEGNIKAVQEELEGRLSKAITMLHNSHNDMSSHLNKVSRGLTSLKIRVGTGEPLAALAQANFTDGTGGTET